MDLNGKITGVSTNLDGTIRLELSISNNKDILIDNYYKLKDKENLSISIKQHREKRSLDANAYCWVLLQKLAEVLKSDKDTLYEEMICKYGVFTHLIVKPKAVERVKEEWRGVRELGEVTLNGKKGIQLQCYFGSSTYDTKEMSVLIDGIVRECQDLGIETLTPDEIADLKRKWLKK